MDGIPFSIVVVEDDADDRIIIDEGFKEIGYEAKIKKVHNGDALLDYLQKSRAIAISFFNRIG